MTEDRNDLFAWAAQSGSPELNEVVSALTDELDPVAPATASRGRLLGALAPDRFQRFAPAVARLLDVPSSVAAKMLSDVDTGDQFEPGPLPGTLFHWVQGGPRVTKAMTGFVRMPQGTKFPDHKHLGDETVLLIQGSCVDGEGAVARPGDTLVQPQGSTHGFAVRPGPDLLYLAVVFEGIEIVGGPRFTV